MKKYFKSKRHIPPRRRDETFTGVVYATQRGFAFIKPDSGDGEFFVPPKNLHGALHGDRVRFYHIRGTDDRAEIISIIQRNYSPLVGTLIADRRGARVFPDDMRRPAVIIPRGLMNGAQSGQKVSVQITAYDRGRPFGKIDKILGEEGELVAEENSIIVQAALKTQFDGDVLEEAQRAANLPLFVKGRRDLRDRIIFTIDNEDTRDIDDAVSIDFDGETYTLGVHIADVAHYVEYGKRLDREAYERATSVYFPDRVLPMLPKELSNGVCSLNEGEDRLALSVDMAFDKSGNRLRYDIYESVIKSRAKMTYRDVTKICGGDEDLRRKYGEISTRIDIMRELCLLLEGKRQAAGSIDLDVLEAHIYIDGEGNIVIPPAERNIAEKIIEQFMIAANEAVAEFVQKNCLPALYRIHEPPVPEKAEGLFAFLKGLGITVKADADNLQPWDFKKILDGVKDRPYASAVNKVTLRSMQKAIYSPVNKEHFGIASKCYCHFTSPIRRYPDITVHRAVKAFMHGKKDEALKILGPNMEGAGKDCSDRERAADEAERKVDDLYKLAYMSDKLGEQFEGIVSGVTAHGIYCELPNTVEGFIPIEDLPADEYKFYEDRFYLKGYKNKFKLGDGIKVIIAACDLGRLKVIMRLAN